MITAAPARNRRLPAGALALALVLAPALVPGVASAQPGVPGLPGQPQQIAEPTQPPPPLLKEAEPSPLVRTMLVAFVLVALACLANAIPSKRGHQD
ncbi:MAG: hypothetical protein ACF8SC_03230 [Phycisphaerales bacterium JB037]